MKVIGLNGKEYVLKLQKYNKVSDKKSKLHLRCRELLREIFPFTIPIEELRIPGTLLKLDFYIHKYSLAVEVMGKQHEVYTPFFHESPIKFEESVERDDDKKKWCEINKIKLVRLNYNETMGEWKKKISMS